MDDPVPQPLRGPFAERFAVAVHHPVDRAITDRVRAHMHPRRMVHPDQPTQRVRVERGVAAVPRVDSGVAGVPFIVQPGRARTAGAVGEELHAARDHMVVARRHVRARLCRALGDQPLSLCRTATAREEHEHAQRQRSLGSEAAVGVESRARNTGLLEARHPLGVEVAHERAHRLLLLRRRERRDESLHESLRRFLEHAGRRAVRCAIDRPIRRVGRVARDVRQP